MLTTKTPISLRIHTACSGFSLCSQKEDRDLRFIHADSKDSDQTGRKGHFVVGFFNYRREYVLVMWFGGLRLSRNRVRGLTDHRYMTELLLIRHQTSLNHYVLLRCSLVRTKFIISRLSSQRFMC